MTSPSRPPVALAPLLALALATSSAPGEAPPALTPGAVDEVRALVMPSKGEETWLEIPWQTDLESARALAARQNRPIFLWEMDGHPLGCT